MAGYNPKKPLERTSSEIPTMSSRLTGRLYPKTLDITTGTRVNGSGQTPNICINK